MIFHPKYWRFDVWPISFCQNNHVWWCSLDPFIPYKPMDEKATACAAPVFSFKTSWAFFKASSSSLRLLVASWAIGWRWGYFWKCNRSYPCHNMSSHVISVFILEFDDGSKSNMSFCPMFSLPGSHHPPESSLPEAQLPTPKDQDVWFSFDSTSSKWF